MSTRCGRSSWCRRVTFVRTAHVTQHGECFVVGRYVTGGGWRPFAGVRLPRREPNRHAAPEDQPQPNDHTLEELFRIIQSRRGGEPSESYTARLFERGVPKIAQKLGEEAVEAVIEAVGGTDEDLATESADLLYHLLVLWAARGIDPADVWRVLEERRGVSGIKEKAQRKGTA